MSPAKRERSAGPLSKQAGLTLIELVVALVIIAMAAMTVVGLMSALAKRSGSALQQTQAVLIANAYLLAIQAEPFAKKGYVDLHYTGALDRNDNPIAGLSQYDIRAQVATSSALGGIPSNRARLITVRVTSPNGFIADLSVFMTKDM